MKLGLAAGKTQLVPYDPDWAALFREEQIRLIGLLGPLILDIQHVGSTAIPACLAKPILDLSISVADLQSTDGLIQLLSNQGWEFKGEAGIPGRHFLIKGPPAGRTHHLHIAEPFSRVRLNHINFRDCLIAHPDLVQQYNDLKRGLAEQFADDVETYTQGKAAFIQMVLARAERDSRQAAPQAHH